ncbi:MAG TPA: hypothetical protein VH062_31380 [Polyangiaceae bacterium]|nr:hypothetical protein [Polyangiaceae bacterium]
MAVSACSTGASDDPGLGATLRVAPAQFVPGAPPKANGGPDVGSVDLATNTIWAGEPNARIGGSLGETATAVALDLVGDRGYWVVGAGPPDVATPGLPSFVATASFADTLAPGTYTLEARAVDGNGHFGAPTTTRLTALPQSPSDTVNGALVVTLTWDTESDLDLHVVDPTGDEIFHGAPISSDTPQLDGADAGTSAGVLEEDSNGNCVIDGRRREDVTWHSPPAGRYTARVDATSLCDAAFANYRVTVVLRGKTVGKAAGTALDSDTWGPHDRGAGLQVLTFDVP